MVLLFSMGLQSTIDGPTYGGTPKLHIETPALNWLPDHITIHTECAKVFFVLQKKVKPRAVGRGAL